MSYPPQGVGDMRTSVYDPNLDGLVAIAQLVAAIATETEVDAKVALEVIARDAAIATHKALATDHHTKTTNASELSAGTLPLARLVNIVNAQISAGAAIAESKLALAQGTQALFDKVAADIATHAGVTAAHHSPTSANTTTLKADDTLRNSNDTEKSTLLENYTKIKEILLNADLPVCRLKFGLKVASGSLAGKAKVYKNGSPIGVEQSNTTTSYVTKSEDFSGWANGDLIQIYAKRPSTGVATLVNNMRFYYAKWLTELGGVGLITDLKSDDDPTISVTNQDP